MTTLEEIEKRADAIFESQKYCDIPISDLARLVRDLAIAVRERSTPELPAATVLGKAERDKWEEMVMAWRDYCGEAECIGELALTTGRAMIADLQKDLDWQAATTKALLEYQDEVASRIGKLEKARNAALARATKAEGTLGDAHGMLAGYVQRGMALDAAVERAEKAEAERDEALTALNEARTRSNEWQRRALETHDRDELAVKLGHCKTARNCLAGEVAKLQSELAECIAANRRIWEQDQAELEQLRGTYAAVLAWRKRYAPAVRCSSCGTDRNVKDGKLDVCPALECKDPAIDCLREDAAAKAERTDVPEVKCLRHSDDDVLSVHLGANQRCILHRAKPGAARDLKGRLEKALAELWPSPRGATTPSDAIAALPPVNEEAERVVDRLVSDATNSKKVTPLRRDGMTRGEAFDMAMTYFRDSDLAERLGNVRKSTVDGIVYGLTNLILSVADSQATECSVHASKRSPEKPKTSPVVAPQAVEHEVTVVGNVVKMNGQHVWTATMPGDPEVLKMNLELALKKGKPASEAAPVAK